mgnify:CR=1 FL=1
MQPQKKEFMQTIFDVTRDALGWMASSPRPLAKALTNSSEESDIISRFVAHVQAAAPSDPVFSLLAQKLSAWDYDSGAVWADGTPGNSRERRDKIYERLVVEPELAALLEEKFPPNLNFDAPVIIAREHTPWYDSARQARQSFYRDAYAQYLRTRKNWTEDQIMSLEESTRLVVERLSDPESKEIFPVRGLVVGYVQSGKTANFTGVVARAADAGYRLIVVLAGTLNILRDQTQRRIDRELIGRPFITAEDDPDYASDLKNFIDHGGLPSERGYFDWDRLTGCGDDYKRLKYGIQALKFHKRDATKPFTHPDNLHYESARLLVVKKNPAVLSKFAADLAAARKNQNLADIPTLVIDDESDQASVNTRKPTAEEIQERTATNSAIVSLLKQLPRAQYVGYTATPFANVFVDPNNEEDLFPRDFIVSLPRPANYMGVADFHDLDRPDREERGPNEEAFVRDVKGDDLDENNLRRAIDSYILAGAIKLFRASKEPRLVKDFRHHTMLVHISHRKDAHHETAAQVSELLADGGYMNGRALPRLKDLWKTDFRRVSATRSEGYPVPPDFDELKPFLGECWARLHAGPRAVLTVNGDSKDNPDFESGPVWKIVVGGAKLSRGYTIEGLTVSYYRRRAGSADSLMQMGRWFGFRDGYRDLVRLYIGRSEPLSSGKGKNSADGKGKKNTDSKEKTIDLFEAFEAACRDEMEFREELRRYAKPADGRPILPIQVPPLVPSHLLRPTAANKMYNTRIEFRNFAKAWKEHTVAPAGEDDILHNQIQLGQLLGAAALKTGTLAVSNADGTFEKKARWKTLSTEAMLAFLEAYRWAGRDHSVLQNEIEFLRSEGNGVDSWLFVYFEGPARSQSWSIDGTKFRAYNRKRTTETRFSVYSESSHRPIVQYLCGVGDAKPGNPVTRKLADTTQGVFVFYPTAEKGLAAPSSITPGFALQFPNNDNPTPIRFSVIVKAREHEPVADVDSVVHEEISGKAKAPAVRKKAVSGKPGKN